MSARRGKKIMATLQKTTNQCEARLGGEYRRWEERERMSFTKCRKTHKQWDEQEGMYQVPEEGKTGIRAVNKKLGNVCN